METGLMLQLNRQAHLKQYSLCVTLLKGAGDAQG